MGLLSEKKFLVDVIHPFAVDLSALKKTLSGKHEERNIHNNGILSEESTWADLC
jgi:hypothetical protein